MSVFKFSLYTLYSTYAIHTPRRLPSGTGVVYMVVSGVNVSKGYLVKSPVPLGQEIFSDTAKDPGSFPSRPGWNLAVKRFIVNCPKLYRPICVF